MFVAAMIHYFYLVAFAWMLFEGVYLYMMVVKVFNTVVRMRLFYITSWGGCLILSLVDTSNMYFAKNKIPWMLLAKVSKIHS